MGEITPHIFQIMKLRLKKKDNLKVNLSDQFFFLIAFWRGNNSLFTSIIH